MKISSPKILEIYGRLILALILLAFVLNSCRKQGDEFKPERAALMLVHASPGLPPIDLFIDANRINGDRIISYTDTIPYNFTNPGSQTITVKKQISSITYISKAYILRSGKHYSIFVTGSPDSVTHVITEDQFGAPVAGKAKLRFLNLSPGSKPLDLKLGPTNTLFTDLPFKCGSDFTPVDPGKYTSGIYEKGSNTSLANQPLDIEAGKFYTIWARGMKGSADPGTALSLQVISVK